MSHSTQRNSISAAVLSLLGCFYISIISQLLCKFVQIMSFTNPSSLQLQLSGRPRLLLQCIMQHLLIAFQKTFGILGEQRKQNTLEGTTAT